MSEKTLDLRVSWGKDGEYTLPGACCNCDWRGTLILSRGHEAPSQRPHYFAACCPRCGCWTVGREKPG